MRNPFRARHEISRRDVDRLLDRSDVADPAHRAVADLLAAAAGPALPHETKGERAAVRRYRQAYAASARPASRGRRPRRIGVLVTATAAALLVGGTGYAARSGQLPESLQRTAHGWFSGVVPAPSTSPSPSRSPAPPPSPSTSRKSPPAVAPPPLLRELCLAWQAVEKDPRARPITPDERRALADAAGSNGKKQIDAFCGQLLGPSPTAAVGPSGRVKPGNPSPGVKKPHK